VRTQLFQRIGLVAVLASVAGSGCASMNNTDKGALAGGAVGTAAGAAIGAATHHPLLGAAIGGLGGAATGALIGNSEDKQEARQRDAANAAAVAQARADAQRIGIADILQMSRDHLADAIIINQIRQTRSFFQLTTSDLTMLKQNGVSDAVIAEMQRPAPPGYVTQPVVYDSSGTVVVVRPAPPPPVIYGGGYYGGYYRRW
jgi:hypothetical protein